MTERIRTERPVVAASEQHPGYVEMTFPRDNRTILMHEQVAMATFLDMMAVITGEDRREVNHGDTNRP